MPFRAFAPLETFAPVVWTAFAVMLRTLTLRTIRAMRPMTAMRTLVRPRFGSIGGLCNRRSAVRLGRRRRVAVPLGAAAAPMMTRTARMTVAFPPALETAGTPDFYHFGLSRCGLCGDLGSRAFCRSIARCGVAAR